MQTMKKLLSAFLAVLFVVPGVISLGMTASAMDFQMGDFIQFGSYPQTEVTDAELIAALNEQSVAWQSYGYYSGDSKNLYIDSDGKMTAKDYMQYGDVTLGGERYRGVKFVQYRPSMTGCVSSEGRSAQDNNGYYIGTTYWFEWEPLRWTVLDPEAGLVLCETVIDAQPFNNYRKTYGQDDYGNGADWGDADRTYYANNYAQSDVRAWLTDESNANSFLNTAFTVAQRDKITPTELNNSAYNAAVANYSCAATTDRVFLPGYDDVQNTAYGFFHVPENESTTRLVQGSDYAKCQGLTVDYANGCSNWRLRTAGKLGRCACYVSAKGAIKFNGDATEKTDIGIRPAMQIDLDYAYATAEYKAKFVADGKTVATVRYMADTTSIQEPDVPEKEGYTGAWKPYSLLVGGVTVETVYTPVTYTATFVADGETVGTAEYTVQTTSIKDKEPAVPYKEGFLGSWKPYTLAIGGITVEAQYEVIGYTAEFYADDVLIGTVNYNAETTGIKDQEPTVPAKDGYTGAWEPYTLDIGGVRVDAVYTPIEYTATFVADGETAGTVKYTVETASIKDKEPAVPNKEGFLGSWKPYTLAIGGVTVEAQYTAIEYAAKFVADGRTVGTVKYTVETTSIKDQEPTVPAKDGYTGAWAPYTLSVGGITVQAQYTPIEYTATFVADGTTVGTAAYTVETTSVQEPAVPKKDGYTGAWKPYTFAVGGVTVEAQYTAIEYTATFVADGATVGTVTYTVETASIKDREPAVPVKEGYAGAWKPYTLAIGGITVEAEYEAIGYTATFVADGKTVGTVNYNAETVSIQDKEPAVPAKEGYTGAWKPYTLAIGGVTVEAQYTAIEYTATFVADGATAGTVKYTVETTSIQAPTVPAKDGYTGAWKPYTLVIGGVTVEAEYTAIEYTATFVADGKTVGTAAYTVETAAVTEPDVPAKEGCTGAWKPYTLAIGGVTVEAVYTPNTYTVTWSVDGKTTKASVTFGSPITKPADPSKEGYTFTGWTPDVPAAMPAQNLTFTAQFALDKYNAVLMADGRQVAVIPYTYGQKSIELPAVPDKEGYTGAWPSYTLPVGGVTITAVYTKNAYTVTWISDGKTTQTTVSYGDPITKPANPSKNGFVFKGWEPAVPATMPAQNLTFTAKFDQVVITDLRITKLPDKTVYTYRRDRNVDLSGMTLEATYSDGSKKTITNMSECKVSGYSAKPRGDKTVLVEYDGQTVQFNVTVKYKWWQWLILIFLLGFIWY